MDLPYKGIVKSIKSGDQEVSLMLLGIKADQEITIIRKSPFGKSYLVEVAGRRLALGAKEMNSIQFRKSPV